MKRELDFVDKATLEQIRQKPTRDADLVSRDSRDKLIETGHVRWVAPGWNFLASIFGKK